MVDVPEKEAYRVMQTNTLVSPALPSPPQLVNMGRQACSLSGTEMVHAFVMKEFCPF